MKTKREQRIQMDPHARIVFTDDQGRVLGSIDRESLRPNRTRFQPGNTAAAKPKWSAKRLQEFAAAVHALRELLGYNYSEMGRALNVTGQYIKLIERTERQPSEKFVKTFRKFRAAPVLDKERVSTEALAHLGEIWNHILAKRFKCRTCAKEVRQGKRHKGLEYWWAASPSQKYCPEHQPQAKR